MSNYYTYEDFDKLGYSNSTITTLISVASFIKFIAISTVKYEFVLACFGVIVNLFHLLILTRKSMGANSVNVVMIGISACDLFNMAFVVYENSVELLHSNPDCWTGHGLFNQVVELYGSAIKDDLRRLTPWLGVTMAVIRFLIVKNSLNPKFKFLSQPKFSWITILITLVLSTCWSLFYFARLMLVETKPWTPAPYCTGFPANYTESQYTLTMNPEFLSNAVLMIQIYLITDGFLKIIPTIMFPILTFLLIRELKEAETARRKISGAVQSKNENSRSDHTTNLVILMTVTFMTAEGPLGVIYVIQGFVASYSGYLNLTLDLADILGLFVALNAITHCVICLTVSSQYRRTVRDVFICKMCKGKGASTIIVTAKVSVSSMTPIQDAALKNQV